MEQPRHEPAQAAGLRRRRRGGRRPGAPRGGGAHPWLQCPCRLSRPAGRPTGGTGGRLHPVPQPRGRGRRCPGGRQARPGGEAHGRVARGSRPDDRRRARRRPRPDRVPEPPPGRGLPQGATDPAERRARPHPPGEDGPSRLPAPLGLADPAQVRRRAAQQLGRARRRPGAAVARRRIPGPVRGPAAHGERGGCGGPRQGGAQGRGRHGGRRGDHVGVCLPGPGLARDGPLRDVDGQHVPPGVEVLRPVRAAHSGRGGRTGPRPGLRQAGADPMADRDRRAAGRQHHLRVYARLRATLREGAPLFVTPESVRRQIALFDEIRRRSGF